MYRGKWRGGSSGGGGGTTSIIVPFAYGAMVDQPSGSGVGVTWTYNSTSELFSVSFNATRPNTNYTVVTDEEYADGTGSRYMMVQNKTTSGFEVDLYGGYGPSGDPKVIMVYAETPTVTVGNGGGGGGGTGTVTSVGTAADGSSGGSITTSGTIAINGGRGVAVGVSSAPGTDFTVSANLAGATNTGASYTFPDTVDVLLADATLGSLGVLSVSLPAAASFTGRVVSVKDNGNAGVSNVIIISSSSGQIDGAATFTLNTALQSVDLWSHNSNWWIL